VLTIFPKQLFTTYCSTLILVFVDKPPDQ